MKISEEELRLLSKLLGKAIRGVIVWVLDHLRIESLHSFPGIAVTVLISLIVIVILAVAITVVLIFLAARVSRAISREFVKSEKFRPVVNTIAIIGTGIIPLIRSHKPAVVIPTVIGSIFTVIGAQSTLQGFQTRIRELATS